MQERVQSMGPDYPEVVVQHDMNLMSVGVSLESQTSVPNQHFLDAIYGDVPTRTAIGTNLFMRLYQEGVISEQTVDSLRDGRTQDQLGAHYAEIGQIVLDSVSGSSAANGMWTWLDRPGANRLIRLLRKARDTAFGRDE